ncbi:MAG: nitroreductase [Planctomycetota bacterium]
MHSKHAEESTAPNAPVRVYGPEAARPGRTSPVELVVLDALRTRRSPRLKDLVEPGPSEAQLHDILTIAARVPDHARLVPWRFITIAGEGCDRLNAVIGDRFDMLHPDADQAKRGHARSRMSHAPLVIAVVYRPGEHPKVPELEQALSAGAACMNLIHACNAHGFGALWLTEWYASDRVVLSAMGLAEHEHIAGFMHIGTQTEERDERARPELADIVTVF